MLIDELNLKERTAVEMKYLGRTHVEIAERIEGSEDTVKGWFKSDGKLYPAYQEYLEYMNKKRQAELENKIAVSDDEYFVTTTNVVRMVAKRMQPYRVLLVDKNGNAIADALGQPQYIMRDPDPKDFDVNDLKTAWQIQRLMQGKPINYEKQDVETTSFEHDVVMKELGLTEDDFSDSKIDETTKRITEYLLAK